MREGGRLPSAHWDGCMAPLAPHCADTAGVGRTKPPQMSGADLKATIFYTSPAWGRIALAVGIALGVLGGVVLLVPRWQAPAPAPAAPHSEAPAARPPVAHAPGGGGGAGAGGGSAQSQPAQFGPPHGMRPATMAEAAAVTHEVPAAAKGTDNVLVADSDPQWAVAHVAAGPGGQGLFVLAHWASSWSAVDSGYPQMPCDELVPTPVQADLGLLMASCP